MSDRLASLPCSRGWWTRLSVSSSFPKSSWAKCHLVDLIELHKTCSFIYVLGFSLHLPVVPPKVRYDWTLLAPTTKPSSVLGGLGFGSLGESGFMAHHRHTHRLNRHLWFDRQVHGLGRGWAGWLSNGPECVPCALGSKKNWRLVDSGRLTCRLFILFILRWCSVFPLTHCRVFSTLDSKISKE